MKPNVLSAVVMFLAASVALFAQTATKFRIPASAVTASTYDNANNAVPANAVDGSLSTRWVGQGDGAFITLISGRPRLSITSRSPGELVAGCEHPDWFFTDADTGGMVFKAPNIGDTTGGRATRAANCTRCSCRAAAPTRRPTTGCFRPP